MQGSSQEQTYLLPIEFSPTKYVWLPETSEDIQVQISQSISTFYSARGRVSFSLASLAQDQIIDRKRILLMVGKILATQLAYILEHLKDDQQDAIASIISIVEPYIEPRHEANSVLPPKSSREISLNVTRGKRAKPQASLD